MKQLTHKLKKGQMQVVEVPAPVLGAGMILVRNYYSIISTGTEGGTVKAARKGLIGKAKERPQQVKQVADILKQQGPVQTYRTVMQKLDSYSPLGYSSAGEVLKAAPDVTGFAPGDLVACSGGGYANHAEIIAVPINLCVKLPIYKKLEVRSKNDEVKEKKEGKENSAFSIHNSDFMRTVMKRSAYNTLGAIALQGIRQADVQIGESCAVIGLGLIGQLTSLILRASCTKVVGIDIDPAMVEIARNNCTDLACTTDEGGLVEKIDEFTEGIGADAVIITAATKSLDPVNLAGQIARNISKYSSVSGWKRTTLKNPNQSTSLERRLCLYALRIP